MGVKLGKGVCAGTAETVGVTGIGVGAEGAQAESNKTRTIISNSLSIWTLKLRDHSLVYTTIQNGYRIVWQDLFTSVNDKICPNIDVKSGHPR